MQILVDIPDEVYNFTMQRGHIPYGVNIAGCIIDGKVLPKGHGRLIDADDLIQDIIDDNQLCIFNSESERIIHDEMVNFAVDRITYASPIIDADK